MQRAARLDAARTDRSLRIRFALDVQHRNHRCHHGRLCSRRRRETSVDAITRRGRGHARPKFLGPNHLEAAIKQLVWEPDFFLVNEIDGYFVPKKFYPATMTPTILKLAKTWTELCRYVMMQLGSEKRFGVGFVFSTSAAAEAIVDQDREGREEVSDHVEPVQGYLTNERELWRPAHDPDLKWLYAAAIHEVDARRRQHELPRRKFRCGAHTQHG